MNKNKAKLKFHPNNFEIIEQGDHVICAVSGKNIPLNQIFRWEGPLEVPEYEFWISGEEDSDLDNPEFKISLLHIDIDLYEATKIILELLYPKVVNGGVIIFDEYGTFGGETIAIDEYFRGKNIEIFLEGVLPRQFFIRPFSVGS